MPLSISSSSSLRTPLASCRHAAASESAAVAAALPRAKRAHEIVDGIVAINKKQPVASASVSLAAFFAAIVMASGAVVPAAGENLEAKCSFLEKREKEKEKERAFLQHFV